MKKQMYLTISIALILLLPFAGLPVGVSANPVAAATAPGLGQAGSFSVLGFSEVTNTNATSLGGDVGVWSGTSISGLTDISVGGAIHQTDGVAQQAQFDASAAFGNMAGQASSGSLGALDGLTVTAGVYDLGAGSLGGGSLYLDGPGVYIFRTTSSLTSAGSIVLQNGANACDLYWQVGTQANLVSGSFAGTIIAGSGIVFGSGVSLDGRALAIGGPVTMIGNSIYGPICPAVVVEEEEDNTTESIVGLPFTGGAPIRGDFPWAAMIASGFCAIALIFGVRAYRRSH